MPIHFLKPPPAVAGGIVLIKQNQGNSGAATAPATTPATFVSSAAAGTGTQLLLGVCGDATVNTPSGFTLIKSQINTNGLYLFKKTAAGETSITITPTVAASVSWWLVEFSGLNLAELQTAGADASAVGTQSTGTTGTTTGATNGLAVAIWGTSMFSGGTNSVTAMSNSHVEQADNITTKTGSQVNVGIAAGIRTPSADGTFTSTATLNATASACGGIMAVFAKL